MIKIFKKFSLIFLLSTLFALHGKIVFYDGTYVIGKVTKVDEASVYIIPVGLDTAEGVLVGNIDSLNMENGMVPVLNSAVKYFYQAGNFIPNNDDWMAEQTQQNYREHIDLNEEYQTKYKPKKPWKYYNFSLLGGVPLFVANSLKEVDTQKMAKMGANIGLNLQFPYFPIGPIDVSAGIRFMTYSFEANHLGALKALSIGGFSNFDLNPVLFFLPENLHFVIEAGLNYNLATDLDQNFETYNIDTPLGITDLSGQKYAGPGLILGTSLDYWLQNLPIAFKLFMNGNVVPQTPPFTSTYTFFGNVGLSMVIVMKRSTNNNPR
tara:strand:- start:1024 stop:1986 length:963 start_codon:yes stop_codon:yes gene_type:complete